MSKTGKETERFPEISYGYDRTIIGTVDHDAKTVEFYSWGRISDLDDYNCYLPRSVSDCKENAQCRKFLSTHKNYRVKDTSLDPKNDSGYGTKLLVGALVAVGVGVGALVYGIKRREKH